MKSNLFLSGIGYSTSQQHLSTGSATCWQY